MTAHPGAGLVWVWAAAAAAALLLAGALVSFDATPAGGHAPLLETPAWRRQGALLLRREAPGGALLLKLDTSEVVYRYDPARRSLSPAGEAEWRRAAGRVARCAEQLQPPPQVLRVDPRVDRLLAGGREVETAGATALWLRASPGGGWAAVVSADGPKRRSLLPFIGGGGASGQHYGQVFALPGATPRGGAARLQPAGARQILTPCWSPDEEFVVYSEMFFFSLYVVETGIPPVPQPNEVSP